MEFLERQAKELEFNLAENCKCLSSREKWLDLIFRLIKKAEGIRGKAQSGEEAIAGIWVSRNDEPRKVAAVEIERSIEQKAS